MVSRRAKVCGSDAPRKIWTKLWFWRRHRRGVGIGRLLRRDDAEQFLNTALIIGRAKFPRINLLALGAHLNVRFTQSLSKPKDCFVPILDCRERGDEFGKNLGPGPWIRDGRNSANRFKRICSNMNQTRRSSANLQGIVRARTDRLKRQGRVSCALCNPLSFVEISVVGGFDSGFNRIHMRAEMGRTGINCFSTPAN